MTNTDIDNKTPTLKQEKREVVITPDLLDHIKQTMQPQVLQFNDPLTGAFTLSVFAPSDSGQGGMKRYNLDADLERVMPRPRALEGLAVFEDVESFILHFNHFKNSDSKVFASKTANRFLSIIDYHEVDKDAGTTVSPSQLSPRHCRHGGVFAPKFSEAYLAWTGRNKKNMGQAEFADFLEDRVLDLHEPPAVNSENEADKKKLKIARMVNKTFADPAKMMDFRKGIKTHEASISKQFVNTQTGETEFEFRVEQHDEKGERVTIPGLFIIAIPVFDNSNVHYEVLVRLKYRTSEGRTTWFYELFRIDLVLENAFNDIKSKIATETSTTVLQGFPESGPYGAFTSGVPRGDVRDNSGRTPSEVYSFWQDKDRILAEKMMNSVRTSINDMF